MHPRRRARRTSSAFSKSQHEQIRGLFEQVIAARGQERAKVFTQLKNLISAHEEAVEAVVHPAAKHAIVGGVAEVAAREKEEAEAKKTLSALGQLDVASGEFDTKIRSLQKAVLAHAKSEEKEEFDKLADRLDDSKLKQMRSDVVAVEADASPRPKDVR